MWQAAHPVWPDTRDGAHAKVYSATVLRPQFAEGWDPGKKAEARRLTRVRRLRYYPVALVEGRVHVTVPETDRPS